MKTKSKLSTDILKIDPARVANKIEGGIREIILKQLKRRGAVVGLSGGIDSSVVSALCARALGRERVLGLIMPEVESSADSIQTGRQVADSLGIKPVLEEITPILKEAGCYRRRDEAIRKLIPTKRLLINHPSRKR